MAKPEVDQTVSDIVDQMTRGVWFSGRSDKELAASKGVPVSTAQGWAAQAARFIRLTMMQDREEIRARIFAGLDGIRALGLSRQRFQDVYEVEIIAGKDGKPPRRRSVRTTKKVADPNLDAAIKAYETQAKMFGLLQPDIVMQAAGNVLDSMTAEQLRVFAETGQAAVPTTDTDGSGTGKSGNGFH